MAQSTRKIGTPELFAIETASTKGCSPAGREASAV
jgi:hypothetical protein